MRYILTTMTYKCGRLLASRALNFKFGVSPQHVILNNSTVFGSHNQSFTTGPSMHQCFYLNNKKD